MNLGKSVPFRPIEGWGTWKVTRLDSSIFEREASESPTKSAKIPAAALTGCADSTGERPPLTNNLITNLEGPRADIEVQVFSDILHRRRLRLRQGYQNQKLES